MPRKWFYFTGDELARYVTLEGVLRVGVPSRPPVEFTPPLMMYDFAVGWLVEAENVEPHSPFGFTVENIADGVLITGGNSEERINTLVRLVEGSSKLGWSVIVATHHPIQLKSVIPHAKQYDGLPLWDS